MHKTLKAKLLLLLLLTLSAIGASMGNKANACTGCARIFDSNGHPIGYGCVNTGHAAFCQANQIGCSQTGFC